MKVIALTGRAGSGKDTAAQLLQYMLTDSMRGETVQESVKDVLSDYDKKIFSIYNEVSDYHILKFAWPVYQIVGILLGRDPEELMLSKSFKTDVQYNGLTGRQLLQKVGTECFRNVLGDRIWLDVMDRELRRLSKLHQAGVEGVIISDLRFINEGVFAHNDWHAIIIKLVGRDAGVDTSHPSESEMEKIQPAHVLSNHTSIVDLANNLAILCYETQLTTNKYLWK